MEKIWFWRPERTGKDEANESVSLRGRSTMLSYGYPRPLSCVRSLLGLDPDGLIAAPHKLWWEVCGISGFDVMFPLAPPLTQILSDTPRSFRPVQHTPRATPCNKFGWDASRRPAGCR